MPRNQNDLRKIMRDKMSKSGGSVPESPLAKISSSGKISCVICPGVAIKNWSTHTLSAVHKRNIQAQKNPKPAEPPISEPKKSVPLPDLTKQPAKSILKNSFKTPTAPSSSDKSEAISVSNSAPKRGAPVDSESLESLEPKEKVSKIESDASVALANTGELPEGFFDDPKLDAKARNIEYKDPAEVEWEQFQKELREESLKSEQVIEVDDEREMKEREIYETDEMISNWEKVRQLELKKEELGNKKDNEDDSDQDMKSEDDEEDDDEAEFEEFLSWRQKAVK